MARTKIAWGIKRLITLDVETILLKGNLQELGGGGRDKNEYKRAVWQKDLKEFKRSCAYFFKLSCIPPPLPQHIYCTSMYFLNLV